MANFANLKDDKTQTSLGQFLGIAALAAALLVWSPATTAAELAPLTAQQLRTMMKSVPGSETKVTVVNLWATWCAPCVKEMPELVQFAKKYSSRGVRLVLVTADDAEDRKKAATFLTKEGIDFQAYYLAEAPDEFMQPFIKNWSSVVPTTVLFNRQGERSSVWAGEINFKELTKRVESLLKTDQHARLKTSQLERTL